MFTDIHLTFSQSYTTARPCHLCQERDTGCCYLQRYGKLDKIQNKKSFFSLHGGNETYRQNLWNTYETRRHAAPLRPNDERRHGKRRQTASQNMAFRPLKGILLHDNSASFVDERIITWISTDYKPASKPRHTAVLNLCTTLQEREKTYRSRHIFGLLLWHLFKFT